MASPMYCFVTGGEVYYVPVETIDEPQIGAPAYPTQKSESLTIQNKNILYSLNDPSISDFDSGAESNGRNQNSSSDEADQEPPHRALYLPLHSIDLSANLSNGFVQVKELFARIFPSVSVGNIEVKQLTGGITNMLLQCKDTSSDLTVLMRVYGQGTNLIIDRHREFVSHLVLNSLGLAPPIYARFHNGLVYGFLLGRSLQPEELTQEKYYPYIAQQLGNWHAKIKNSEIEIGLDKLRRTTMKQKRRSLSSHSPIRSPRLLPRNNGSLNEMENKNNTLPNNNIVITSSAKTSTTDVEDRRKKKKRSITNIWELMEDWINIVPPIPELVSSFQENLPQGTIINTDNIRQVLSDEFESMKKFLSKSSSPIVSCHCDLLSGNVIVPEEFEISDELKDIDQNQIRFIDYEYMLPAPRAFDIANHMAEWQGFNCDRSAIPEPSSSNPVMVKWVKGYLNNAEATDDEVNKLIDEISLFFGMPGFYWGIWAMIQSEISTIDFNYANYGKLRFQEYWDWKKKYQFA